MVHFCKILNRNRERTRTKCFHRSSTFKKKDRYICLFGKSKLIGDLTSVFHAIIVLEKIDVGYVWRLIMPGLIHG